MRRVLTLRGRMRALIAENGPLTVAQFMTMALHDPMSGYYARRAALGAGGDFITAPETSQMFGELVGLWCAQSWSDLGEPAPFHLIELGPGTGVLMRDSLRAMKAAPACREAARVHMVEASGVLRTAQEAALADVDAVWHGRFEEAPDGPAIIVGNEFLDCLPIRQFVRTHEGWRERLVGAGEGEALAFGLAPAPAPEARVPAELRDAPEGSVAEISPALAGLVDQLAARLRAQPGRALFIDYGAPQSEAGDTLQAMSRHQKVHPLDDPGGADLTAHVDFGALAALARDAGLDVAGPKPQGAWLRALGIEMRAAALSRSRPDRADVIARQLHRLTHANEMGALFQVICLSSPGLTTPAGFEP